MGLIVGCYQRNRDTYYNVRAHLEYIVAAKQWLHYRDHRLHIIYNYNHWVTYDAMLQEQ